MVTIIVIKISQKLCSWGWVRQQWPCQQMEYSVSLWYKYFIFLKNLEGGDYIVTYNKDTKYCLIYENTGGNKKQDFFYNFHLWQKHTFTTTGKVKWDNYYQNNRQSHTKSYIVIHSLTQPCIVIHRHTQSYIVIHSHTYSQTQSYIGLLRCLHT